MKFLGISLFFLIVFSFSIYSQLIIDYNCTNISVIPQSAIENAKEQLHIAYGHTSHGSQVTTGMNGLVDFANSGGRGLSLPNDIFEWNNGGTDGALDLHDYAMSGDVGYYPDWYNNTISYLESPENSNVNVIMWSWCGQVDSKYDDGVLYEEFLEPMNILEAAYPDVIFVYMTGHLEYSARESVNAANDSIRSYCLNNNKVLFDFADIESYGPDGTCYKDNADDACNYYNESGEVIGNWAVEYQNSHEEGVDWYECESAHSEPFNANLKAYAAWWMFASLAGWNYSNPVSIQEDYQSKIIINGNLYPNPAINQTRLELDTQENRILSVDLISVNGEKIKCNLLPVISSNKLVYEIDTHELSSGIYFILVKTDLSSQSFKLMVI
ncbi:MAG: T9SS type A sorting domain-containing protein [Bacteroidales bacterium]|nr:T9SS type A sorting domain-containing protein [Bacteroidales bacterium]